jgi:prevent-host-death family protein
MSIRHKGAEEARSQLPSLLDAAEGGASTLITRRGRPVAVLAPVNGLAGQCVQASLLPVRGSGQGLWGPDIAETLAAARSEWDRQTSPG